MNDVYYSVEPYTGDIICHKGLGAASPFTREAMRKRAPSFFANEEDRKKFIREQKLRKKIDKIGDLVKGFSKKWGFTNGVPNGNRKAKGKIDPNTGRYIYSNGSGTGYPVNYTRDNEIEYKYVSPYTGKKMTDTSTSNYTDYNPLTGKRKDGTVKVLKRKYKGSITDSLIK